MSLRKRQLRLRDEVDRSWKCNLSTKLCLPYWLVWDLSNLNWLIWFSLRCPYNLDIVILQKKTSRVQWICQWIMKFSEIRCYCLKTYQKEKRKFFYPCTDNFKTRNFGTLSVDYIEYTDICIGDAGMPRFWLIVISSSSWNQNCTS